jgi:hypothetical protein
VRAQYQVLCPTAPVSAPGDVLEAFVGEGARRMLQRALEAEVEEFPRLRLTKVGYPAKLRSELGGGFPRPD